MAVPFWILLRSDIPKCVIVVDSGVMSQTFGGVQSLRGSVATERGEGR